MTHSADPIPLILLPGLLCTETLWRHQTKHLSDIAQVSVGDLTQDDSVAGMARSVLATAPPRFALAGLSMGGIVAFEIMRQAPERILKLALLDTNAGLLSPESTAEWRTFFAKVDEGGFNDIAEQLLPGMIHPDHQQDGCLINAIQQMAKSVGPEAFLRQVKSQLTRVDSRPSLRNIACPTLVLAGRQDTTCPVEMHREIAVAIPGATLVIIEDCGHLSSMEQPQAVSAVLRYWLQI